MSATVILKQGRVKPLLYRHPWVFAGSIARIDGTPEDGGVVDVCSPKGRFIARGFYNSRSQLRVRVFAFEQGVELDGALIRARIDAAARLRAQLLSLPTEETTAYRVVHGDADGLPGLVVDRYGDRLVICVTTLALDQRKEMVLDALEASLSPVAIFETYDKTRQLEGLPPAMGLRRGAAEGSWEIRERGLVFTVDLLEGQKTGFYLDQRENRARVEALSAGRRVLDCFSYTGAFALSAARGGAAEVTGIESSAAAIELSRQNAERNQLDVTWVHDDVYKQLGSMRRDGRGYGLVVLDPPRYASGHSRLRKAKQKYKELIGLGLAVTEPEGILLCCSCSGLLPEPELEALIRDTSAEASRRVRVFERGGQAADHPVSIHCPEGRYLKAIFCHVS